MIYAQVIVAQRTNVEELTYAVPAQIIPYIKPGSTVLVPIRRKVASGVVVKLQRQVPRYLQSKIREIISIEREQGLSSAQISTIHRLAEYYGASLAEVAYHALRFPSRLLPEKRATLKKPLMVQASWEERTKYYQKIILRHPEKRVVIIFSVENYAHNFFSSLSTDIQQRTVNVAGRSVTTKEKKLLGEDNGPLIWIGQQNIIFAPLHPGDVLIIDQPDHVGAKQQRRPFMTTKRIALARCQSEGIQVVLGSDLIGPLDYGRVTTENWRLVKESYESIALSIYSRLRSPFLVLPSIEEQIANDLRSQKKVLILAASRGWATALVCKSCAQVVSCPRCERTMSVNSSTQLRCGYCSKVIDRPETCPACHRKELSAVGEGTSQLESYFKSKFPRTAPAVITSESKTLPGVSNLTIATEKIFSFPSITYDSSYVLSLDRFLSGTEINDSWHLLLLMMQLRSIAKKISIQTYFPDHPLWGVVSTASFDTFYEQDLAVRRKYHLPPFGQQLSVINDTATKTVVKEAAEIETMISGLIPDLAVGQLRLNRNQAEIPLLSQKVLTSVQKKALRQALPLAWTIDVEKNQL